jgi:hypothetical protein
VARAWIVPPIRQRGPRWTTHSDSVHLGVGASRCRYGLEALLFAFARRVDLLHALSWHGALRLDVENLRDLPIRCVPLKREARAGERAHRPRGVLVHAHAEWRAFEVEAAERPDRMRDRQGVIRPSYTLGTAPPSLDGRSSICHGVSIKIKSIRRSSRRRFHAVDQGS